VDSRLIAVIEDIDARKRYENALRENERLFREMLDALPAAIYTTDAKGYVTHFNRAAAVLSGRHPAVGDHWCVSWKLYYADGRRMPHHKSPMAIALKEGRPVFGREAIAERPDGTRIWFTPYPVPLRDEKDRVIGGINMLVDITERKHIEEDMRHHRDHLQELVDERTAETLEANSRLRNTERMAVIGTLSAGLGHDMANLLVPVHIRLEALARMELGDDADDHLLAIKSSAQYLQKLSSGLRLLATDTTRIADGGPTHLRTWSTETGGILRTVLPGSVALDVEMPDVWVAMTRPALMQAVFNLVQNAGDVLRDRTDGHVHVHGEVDGDSVNIIVTDNGPGMTEEVRGRCLEPFFTTRHRSISTGLGLSIVYGLVKEAGGVVDVQSQFGHGTTVTLHLKRGVAPEDRPLTPSRSALVQVGDARLRAIVAAELQALYYDVVFDTASRAPDLVVCDHWPLATAVQGPVVLLADGRNMPASAIALGPKPAVQAIRNALREVAA
jgi:PAS domain S-box-containing protein